MDAPASPPALASDSKVLSEVLPGLFLGNDVAARDRGTEFAVVVNCTPGLPFAAPAGGAQVQVRVAVADDPFDSVPLFQILRDTDVLAQMHAALCADARPVLVHCQAGAQRSPAVVAAYLMRYYGLGTQDAIDFVKSRRHVAFFWDVNLRRALELFCAHVAAAAAAE
jgi:protein tyrosine phosphatase (PTP) superfamily phosphohydrolase (DUF442 family)